jgi:transposase
LSHGVPRVDDRRVVSGIVYLMRNGLQWNDAPPGYGPHKTLYNRCIRSRLGVFDRFFSALASEGPTPERIMIDDTHMKAHRTAASLSKKGLFPAASGARLILDALPPAKTLLADRGYDSNWFRDDPRRDNGRRCGDDQQEFAERLAVDRGHLSEPDDPEAYKQRNHSYDVMWAPAWRLARVE